jgi:hypothetical protein
MGERSHALRQGRPRSGGSTPRAAARLLRRVAPLGLALWAAGCSTSRFVLLDEHYEAARAVEPPILLEGKSERKWLQVGWVEVSLTQQTSPSSILEEALKRGQSHGCEALAEEAVMVQAGREGLEVVLPPGAPAGAGAALSADEGRKRYACLRPFAEVP